ncbi:MAG: ABC transporter [Spirochaetales bacterium]|nr:MAG: ABC transporter [Spirochaetales bacterium]
MIRAEDLSRHYGPVTAVDNISFHIRKGEIIGFLGPNGAGKTTTMNMITGYLAPSSGRILIDGTDIIEAPEETKKLIGYLPEQPPLYQELTVDEYLNFVAAFKKTPKNERRAHLQTIKELVKIDDVHSRLIRNLSKGYKQRVGLAQALVGNPPLLILDEPTVGLDPKQIIEIRELIRELGKEHTVVLSSHILPEISATCGRILIISQGRIAASDTPDNLSRRLSGAARLQLLVKGSPDKVKSSLGSVSNLKELKVTQSASEGLAEAVLEAEGSADIRESVFRALVKTDLPIMQMRPLDLSLEDIFLNLTTQEENA